MEQNEFRNTLIRMKNNGTKIAIKLLDGKSLPGPFTIKYVWKNHIVVVRGRGRKKIKIDTIDYIH